MSVQFRTNQACSTLVGARPQMAQLKFGYVTFVTISPNPGLFHRIKSRKKGECAVKYSQLPLPLQYEYCIKIFEKVYLPYLRDPTYIGTFELNQSGNVHLHILIKDPDINSVYGLHALRKRVASEPLVLQNYKNNHSQDFMNNIVPLDKKSFEEMMVYFDKDHKMKPDAGIEKFNFYGHFIENATTSTVKKTES